MALQCTVFSQKEQFQALLEALCYHPQDISADNVYAFIMTEFSNFNLAVAFDSQGHLTSIELISAPEDELDDLLVPIAPYVELGSFLECAFHSTNQHLAANEIAVIRFQFNHHQLTTQLFAVQQDRFSKREISRRLLPNLHIAA